MRDDLLDAEEERREGQLDSRYKPNVIRNILYFELVLLAWITYCRIDLIITTIELYEWRGMMSMLDYENGWGLIILSILFLINSYLLLKKYHPILWAIKIGAFLSLMLITELSYWFLNLFFFLLTIYYCLPQGWSKFGIRASEFIVYLILAFGVCYGFIYLDDNFGFLIY